MLFKEEAEDAGKRPYKALMYGLELAKQNPFTTTGLVRWYNVG